MAIYKSAEIKNGLAIGPAVQLVLCPDHTLTTKNGLVNQVEFLGLEAHYGMYSH